MSIEIELLCCMYGETPIAKIVTEHVALETAKKLCATGW